MGARPSDWFFGGNMWWKSAKIAQSILGKPEKICRKRKTFLIYNSDEHSSQDIVTGMCEIFKVISNNQHNARDVVFIF